MTESKWLECADPTPMLGFMRGKACERELRLFAVACCRRVWSLLLNPLSESAVQVAERFAEGTATESELENAFDAADAEGSYSHCGAYVESARYAASGAARLDLGVPHDVSGGAVSAAGFLAAYQGYLTTPKTDRAENERASQEERAVHANLLREIFGNPFRPVTIDTVWLTPTVTSLSQAAYEERIMPSGELEPARLAVLSDALEEAGCENSDILAHLRGSGPHVRGCWAVDLLLGKE